MSKFPTVVKITFSINLYCIRILFQHKFHLLFLNQISYYNYICPFNSFYQNRLCQHLLFIFSPWSNLEQKQLQPKLLLIVHCFYLPLFLTSIFFSFPQSLFFSFDFSLASIQVCCSLILLIYIPQKVFCLYKLFSDYPIYFLLEFFN